MNLKSFALQVFSLLAILSAGTAHAITIADLTIVATSPEVTKFMTKNRIVDFNGVKNGAIAACGPNRPALYRVAWQVSEIKFNDPSKGYQKRMK